MKFQNGWIKLHRKIYSSDIAMDGHKINHERISFWLYLLCSVNIYESKIKHGFKDVTIPAGGMAFSYLYLSNNSGLAISKVRRIINYLRNTDRIYVSTTNKGSYLIIKKWEQYQILDASSDGVELTQVNNNRTTSEQQPNNKRQQIEEVKNIRKKKVKRKKSTTSVKTVSLINLDFLSPETTDFIIGVSDSIRLKWLARYSKETIQSQLLAAKDWSEAKGRKPKNVAMLMNTFFKDTPHDKWKDENGGVDPEEKALADELNRMLEEGRAERCINA